jgi:hypothetical protein
VDNPAMPTDYAETVAAEIIEQASYSLSQGHRVSVYVRGIPEPIQVAAISCEAYTAILSHGSGAVYHLALTEVFGVRIMKAEN